MASKTRTLSDADVNFLVSHVSTLVQKAPAGVGTLLKAVLSVAPPDAVSVDKRSAAATVSVLTELAACEGETHDPKSMRDPTVSFVRLNVVVGQLANSTQLQQFRVRLLVCQLVTLHLHKLVDKEGRNSNDAINVVVALLEAKLPAFRPKTGYNASFVRTHHWFGTVLQDIPGLAPALAALVQSQDKSVKGITMTTMSNFAFRVALRLAVVLDERRSSAELQLGAAGAHAISNSLITHSLLTHCSARIYTLYSHLSCLGNRAMHYCQGLEYFGHEVKRSRDGLGAFAGHTKGCSVNCPTDSQPEQSQCWCTC